VPGVAYDAGPDADVMRGEEVQIVGAVAAGLVPPDGLLCHPGTHNKWVRLEGGRIQSFRTVMTGEMFSLLKQHSILSDLLAGPVRPGPAFEAGVRRGFGHDALTAELFRVRARVLLGKGEEGDAASYVSGLLIGTDVRIGIGATRGEDVVVMGRPELTMLSCTALTVAGRPSRGVDGEEAFLAGIRRLAELMQ